MLIKSHIIRGDNYLDTPCLVKVNYGKKYIIVKCMRQSDALKRIENGINAYIRGGINNPNGLYYFFNEYVKKHRELTFKVETLLTNTSAYELLKAEQLALNEGIKSKDMLNNQVEAYIPAYNEEKKMYGWIPPVAVLQFNNWLKSQRKATKKAVQ